MGYRQLKGLSSAASTYHKKLVDLIGNPDAIQLDLIRKICEQWDTYKLCSESMQKHVEQHGDLTVVQPSGQVRLHPLFQMSQATMASYLKLLGVLRRSTDASLPPAGADELEEYL